MKTKPEPSKELQTNKYWQLIKKIQALQENSCPNCAINPTELKLIKDLLEIVPIIHGEIEQIKEKWENSYD